MTAEERGWAKFREVKQEALQRDQERKATAMARFFEYLQNEDVTDNIDEIQLELNDKVLHHGFKNYDQIDDPLFKQFAKQVE